VPAKQAALDPGVCAAVFSLTASPVFNEPAFSMSMALHSYPKAVSRAASAVAALNDTIGCKPMLASRYEF
jgi:hypothetical protein